MPSVSHDQHNAMEAAAHGHSTLGIPANVGREFVAADKGSPFPEYMDAQRGHQRKSKTHRGRRSRKASAAHHAEAKKHIAKAGAATDPHKAHAHLFRAVSFLNKARKAAP